MYKRVLFIFLFVFVLSGIALFYYVKPYFTPAIPQQGLNVVSHSDDTIRIAYIGDSWAHLHESIPNIIEDSLRKQTGTPVQVKIAGISGLTSKNIYYSLFRNETIRELIEWGPDFCVVVAGINDTNRKMGGRYYRENMKLIISLLLHYSITPIILEIPDYDIVASFKRGNRQTKLTFLCSMLITGSSFDCKDEYRLELIKLISRQKWNDSIIYISRKQWNPDGYHDSRMLYDKGKMHLNTKGYIVLDTCISNAITNYLEKLP